MKVVKRTAVAVLLLMLCAPACLFSSPCSGVDTPATDLYVIENEWIKLQVVFRDKVLLADTLTGSAAWFGSYGHQPVKIVSDAGFGLDIAWTGWRAPGKNNNGDIRVLAGKDDFLLQGFRREEGNGRRRLVFTLGMEGSSLQAILTYEVGDSQFYARRKLSVRDTAGTVHFLHTVTARKGPVTLIPALTKGRKLPLSILNPGGFGQPLAVGTTGAGAFFGLEYPASMNDGRLEGDILQIDLSQECGEKLGPQPVHGDWAVTALVPGPWVQSWFYDYLEDIRAAPASPFTLYNSWYDLRSPEYPGVQPEHVMNTENISRIIDLLRLNMIEKHGIKLDAFVLDDGWDVYESDWVMRKETFPDGLRPVKEKLDALGTRLGIWFGPTGGYSFRMKRVDWMKEHGYEVTGEGRDHAMLCLGGKLYSRLFEDRVREMSRNGVSYFKWDGIQFSCSEAGHGHPAGIFSRRAILGSLIEKCNAVREINPGTYLNITSGTWLSPWWVKYANQIWMDGGDYGFADVPSVDKRDAAITYRDFVLYDDFTNKGLWFPVSNLMTHGIIKGRLESVGTDAEPLDKFTHDVVLYFARGISMYELYISPDLLSDGEWDAIGRSLLWAKEKEELLAKTFMAGGNPTRGESYAYLHFKGKSGIIAARNPVVSPSQLQLVLDPKYGLDHRSSGLVVEKVYPCRYIFPELYAAGSTLNLPLEGFETAVYEVYPVEEARYPLLAGARFTMVPAGEKEWQLDLAPGPNVFFLNPGSLKGMSHHGRPVNNLRDLPVPRLAPVFRLTEQPAEGVLNRTMDIAYVTSLEGTRIRLSVLLKPAPGSEKLALPPLQARLGETVLPLTVEQEEGKWYWVSVEAPAGEHRITVAPVPGYRGQAWEGKAELWVQSVFPEPRQRILIQPVNPPAKEVRLPLPWTDGHVSQLTKQAVFSVSLSLP